MTKLSARKREAFTGHEEILESLPRWPGRKFQMVWVERPGDRPLLRLQITKEGADGNIVETELDVKLSDLPALNTAVAIAADRGADFLTDEIPLAAELRNLSLV